MLVAALSRLLEAVAKSIKHATVMSTILTMELFYGLDPCRGLQHSSVEIDHEIISMVILSLLLIQEGQLSVSGKRICTILVNRLEV